MDLIQECNIGLMKAVEKFDVGAATSSRTRRGIHRVVGPIPTRLEFIPLVVVRHDHRYVRGPRRVTGEFIHGR